MNKKPNFYELFKNALDEKNVSIAKLQKERILKNHTIYNFNDNCPSLNNAMQIANYLEMSLDYILENTTKNHFKKYKIPQKNFYRNFEQRLNEIRISKNKLSKESQISLTTFRGWKNGSIPKLSNVIIISKVLDCRIDDLLETE